MPTYKAPLNDVRFVLNEVFSIGQLAELPGHEDHTPDLIEAVLEEGAKLAENVLQPLNRSGDEEGCRYENGVVRTPACAPPICRSACIRALATAPTTRSTCTAPTN
jgi:hypothetical protein